MFRRRQVESGSRPAILPSLLQTAVLSEALALPIAIILIAGRPGSWQGVLVVVSIFAQCTGFICRTAFAACWAPLLRMSTGRQQAAALSLFFLGGLMGQEIAGRAYSLLFGLPWGGPRRFIDLGVAATLTWMAGIALTTFGRLRVTLADTERRLRERELREEQLLRAKTEAELLALRARINPHFLFNTLNSIAALIRDDPGRAEAVTWQLASLFRYALQANTRTLVTLDEELEIVRRYLEIEQVRLGERLRYEISVDPALTQLAVPALLLQPLVENAIKHGIAPQIGGGSVSLRGWRDGDLALFSIHDCGGSVHPSDGSGEGLENVRQRLVALYGDRASVTLSASPGGTEARLVLPLSQAMT